MTFVLDASAAAAWLMPDERAFDVEAAMARHGTVVAPGLFWFEVRNMLLSNERRRRIPEGLAERMMAALDALGLTLDHQPSEQGVMSLARRHGLTVYDAVYLDLALRQGLCLATLDQALIRAAKAEGVEIVTGGGGDPGGP